MATRLLVGNRKPMLPWNDTIHQSVRRKWTLQFVIIIRLRIKVVSAFWSFFLSSRRLLVGAVCFRPARLHHTLLLTCVRTFFFASPGVIPLPPREYKEEVEGVITNYGHPMLIVKYLRELVRPFFWVSSPLLMVRSHSAVQCFRDKL
jgi:hypothetical protein